jgi:diguanylate cyclase
MSTRQIALRGWIRRARWTALGTLACILVSVMVNVVLFRGLGHDIMWRAMISAIVLPLILAMPLFTYLGIRLRKLALANQRLGVVASIDRLTACLNRGAFTDRVNAYLEQAEFGTVPQCGALLVIDADHFKAINDRFGHDMGDEALTTIARTIRAMLRHGDTVGRLGGEEFGVFLPAVDLATASLIAERIRRAISLAVFAPGGELRPLSVSIGGAFFDSQIEFTELFRHADGRLYDAKSFGRNRVDVGATRRIPDTGRPRASVA